ncbi:MAG: hypothetical protein EZS28_027019 [Streblomastix strix]|uniref:Uncharacterized protein n=1 Tax=Streblomastix strix TaxID=222440 RepID=A0A5J4V5Q0_9EUKA|nr:MAG: hypothetical protein EZS28_027019 [Streblomastix strix]
MRNEEKRNETVNYLEQCIQSMQKTSALCKLSKDLQRVLDGLDRCDRKLDAKIAGVQPYRTNKKNTVCFDEAHSDTAFEMRMSLKERIQDEIHWMNSECSAENRLHNVYIEALESLNIDWKSIWKAIWETAIKYACESKICH